MEKPLTIPYTRLVGSSLGYVVVFIEDSYSRPRMNVRVTGHPILGAVPC